MLTRILFLTLKTWDITGVRGDEKPRRQQENQPVETITTLGSMFQRNVKPARKARDVVSRRMSKRKRKITRRNDQNKSNNNNNHNRYTNNNNKNNNNNSSSNSNQNRYFNNDIQKTIFFCTNFTKSYTQFYARNW